MFRSDLQQALTLSPQSGCPAESASFRAASRHWSFFGLGESRCRLRDRFQLIGLSVWKYFLYAEIQSAEISSCAVAKSMSPRQTNS